MLILEYAIALVAGYLIFHLSIYGAQRLVVHQPRAGVLYRAHTIGHHGVYAPDRYEADAFHGYRESWLTDYGFGVPLLVAGFFVLRRDLFVLVAAETVVLGVGVAWAHRAFHVKGHWLKRLPGFAYYDRMHREHHRNLRVNYGFLFVGWDRLFGTLADPERRNSGSRGAPRRAFAAEGRGFEPPIEL